MSIKDRLGEKQVPRNSNPEGVDEDLTENCYEKEIREMEQDLNIIINVTNIRNEDSEDRQVNIGKGKNLSRLMNPIDFFLYKSETCFNFVFVNS